jgi:hypothetical protein
VRNGRSSEKRTQNPSFARAQALKLVAVRKFAGKSFRYMDAYSEIRGVYLSPEQAEYSVKKYKSHRSVRDTITDEDFAKILKL